MKNHTNVDSMCRELNPTLRVYATRVLRTPTWNFTMKKHRYFNLLALASFPFERSTVSVDVDILAISYT